MVIQANQSDERLAHDRWRTWLPLGAVVVALFALVFLPVLRSMQLGPVFHDIRTVVEPSRSLLTRIHVALAMEQSLLRDYLEDRDSVTVARYLKAVEEERQAYSELAVLVSELGPAVKVEFDQVRELERGWHAEIDKFLLLSAGQRLPRDPLHARLYEDLLLGVARLDAALNAAAQRRWASIEGTNRAQEWLTFSVGLIALAAAVILAWLGRRLRTYALREATARHELEAATESKERLMRGVTHDLKNPLQAISGHAEMLEEGLRGPLTPGQRDSIASIRGSVQHLLSMISDLIDLSRAEGGKLDVRPVATDLGDVVRQTVADFVGRSERASLQLKSSIAQDVPQVVTDPDRVKQVLQNLLSNAIKYTPAGGSIEVTLMPRSPDGAAPGSMWVAIDVSDTGEGIPLDHTEAIFEEFIRLSDHADRPGAGLGLAIARRIARLLGGDLTLASSTGGSTFTLWLPRDRRAGPVVTGT